MTDRNAWRMSIDDFRHESFSELDSTNTACMERGRAGDPGNLWITAGRQLGGKARRGRSWVSERGNLYASLLLVDPAPVTKLASLPLAVSLAVHDAVRKVMPPGSEAVEIKWPNDILIGRKKTCGILLEGGALPEGRHAVVIGIGINIVTKPDNVPYDATCLAEHGAAVSPDELFAHLFATMVDALNLWDKGRGVRAVVKRWRENACGIGERIRVNLPDRSLTGRFLDIDDNGLLLLQTDDGAGIPIAAGDVFFE
ncbi:biotin--[acetyl-CoA-carboxylase] ligase [Rhizobium sp. NRK18]|uniref:biotin--[acetyl-CoA-carboxylase] ligase n=1 Tax=Rhizobium sp. NRK18 TaxID=2964667 RepID=UPI0021C3B213|nr:biotin--[acetyl-CoA-carboxylase] ligase [Rhizobium sp. NRK18]MCQ2004575.1 biotin--[acetyl-CoA-carboxylase] ligase [Rhizobium sp. NRK18]